MSTMEALTSRLSAEIDDPEEETFLLFATDRPGRDLGMVDGRASTIEVSVCGRDLTIHQSPGVLSSTRAGGTTGAVVWQVTPLMAEWMATPSERNPLFAAGLVGPSATVLELGCGISPLLALAMAPHVAHYVLSDQTYVQRLVSLNLEANAVTPSAKTKGKGKSRGGAAAAPGGGNISFRALDWETDAIGRDLSPAPTGDFDLVVACDCVFNYALVAPLVGACVDACKLRSTEGRPTVCLVAQQLRSDDVFQTWMAEFHRRFRVWRFPEDILPVGLRPEDGFVIHAGILRD